MSNPNRYDYDSDEYYYDEDYDEVCSKSNPDERYKGDGEKIDFYSDWLIQTKTKQFLTSQTLFTIDRLPTGNLFFINFLSLS